MITYPKTRVTLPVCLYLRPLCVTQYQRRASNSALPNTRGKVVRVFVTRYQTHHKDKGRCPIANRHLFEEVPRLDTLLTHIQHCHRPVFTFPMVTQASPSGRAPRHPKQGTRAESRLKLSEGLKRNVMSPKMRAKYPAVIEKVSI